MTIDPTPEKDAEANQGYDDGGKRVVPTPGRPPALRHGIYSDTLLPNEDLTQFEELRAALALEFTPRGALEHDIVGTLARLIWRKQHLARFRMRLADDLDLENRLDRLIDRCVKRLLFARGVKSLGSESASRAAPRLLPPSQAA
jgi:hypothetical protein